MLSKESAPIEPSRPVPRVTSSSEDTGGCDVAGTSTRDRLFKWVLQLDLSRSLPTLKSGAVEILLFKGFFCLEVARLTTWCVHVTHLLRRKIKARGSSEVKGRTRREGTGSYDHEGGILKIIFIY